jgi:hypothetical protein
MGKLYTKVNNFLTQIKVILNLLTVVSAKVLGLFIILDILTAGRFKIITNFIGVLKQAIGPGGQFLAIALLIGLVVWVYRKP